MTGRNYAIIIYNYFPTSFAQCSIQNFIEYLFFVY